LQAFLDNAPLMVFVKDAEGRFLFVNRAMEKAFQMPDGACLGKVDRDAIPEELALRTEHNDKLVMRERRSMEFEEVVPIAGKQRIFLTTKVPMLDMQGNVYAVLGVAADITRLKKIEEELRCARRNLELLIDERTRELHKSKEQLRALSRSLISAQEAERRRIAQDIHDQAGEMITIVSIELENLRRRFPDSADAVRLITANVTELSDTLRSICYGLHPVVLDRFGLSAAMEQFINEFQKGTSIEVISHIQCIHLEDLPPVIALCFYRALQESLTNIARHAGACRASVWLSRKGRDLILTVEDTGRGFDTHVQSTGLGLFGMRERAAACGAVLHVKSAVGAGAVITLSFPISAPQGEIP